MHISARQAVVVNDYPSPNPPAQFSSLLTNMSLYLQGGLRNSKHECTLSSQEYVHELRSGITDERLLNCLESLRVSLTSNPVRSVSWACSCPTLLLVVTSVSLHGLLTGPCCEFPCLCVRPTSIHVMSRVPRDGRQPTACQSPHKHLTLSKRKAALSSSAHLSFSVSLS